jgi:hypothetical protein
LRRRRRPEKAGGGGGLSPEGRQARQRQLQKGRVQAGAWCRYSSLVHTILGVPQRAEGGRELGVQGGLVLAGGSGVLQHQQRCQPPLPERVQLASDVLDCTQAHGGRVNEGRRKKGRDRIAARSRTSLRTICRSLGGALADGRDWPFRHVHDGKNGSQKNELSVLICGRNHASLECCSWQESC